MAISLGFIGRGSFYKDLHDHLVSNGRESFNFTRARERTLIADVLVNYGLYGQKLSAWENAHPTREFGAILNSKLFGNKYDSLLTVDQAAGVPVPMSLPSITQRDATSAEWIAKPYFSFGGKNIFPIGRVSEVNWDTHYAQRRVLYRRYELRVHVFRWVPKSDWLVSKRLHPDGESQLTWNHHQGGSFRNISRNEGNTGVFKRAKDYAEKAAKELGYDFCSVDFIVGNANPGSEQLPLYFIEVNTATGFTTDRTRDAYRSAFLKLSNFRSADDLLAHLGGESRAAQPPPPVRAQDPQPRQST